MDLLIGMALLLTYSALLLFLVGKVIFPKKGASIFSDVAPILESTFNAQYEMNERMEADKDG